MTSGLFCEIISVRLLVTGWVRDESQRKGENGVAEHPDDGREDGAGEVIYGANEVS
jgi:hypothetical protein